MSHRKEQYARIVEDIASHCRRKDEKAREEVAAIEAIAKALEENPIVLEYLRLMRPNG